MSHWTISFNTNEDPLRYEKYTFILVDNVLVLSSYSVLERETTKHKFKLTTHYDRIIPRQNTCKLKDVPFDLLIKTKALTSLFERFNNEIIVSTDVNDSNRKRL